MLPAADKNSKKASRKASAPPAPARETPVDSAAASPLPPVAQPPMRPIGPEGLRALRKAIQSGAYPTDAAVRAGLERMIRKKD